MTDRILTEDGFALLDEGGGHQLLERAAPAGDGFLDTEDGFHLLLESGDKIELEGFASVVVVTPPAPSPATVPASGRDEIHPETRRYWESERTRLRVLRDDDEVLVLL
jgi:hypothetical protein